MNVSMHYWNLFTLHVYKKLFFSYAHEVQIGSDEKRFLMFGYTKVETDSSSTIYPFEN